MPQKLGIAARVSTGLKQPVQVAAADLGSPVPAFISEHVQNQWHRRVLPDRPRKDALIEMVRILESGTGVHTRRSPYRWVRSSRNNSLYFAIGHDIILPAEPVLGSDGTVTVMTCMVNPTSKRPFGPESRRKGHSNSRARRRR